MAEPQVQARQNVIRLPTDDGALAMPGIVPRIDGITAEIRHAGPAIGADSDQVLARLGFAEREIAVLRCGGTVWA